MRAYLGGIYIGEIVGDVEYCQAVTQSHCEIGEFKRFVPDGNPTGEFTVVSMNLRPTWPPAIIDIPVKMRVCEGTESVDAWVVVQVVTEVSRFKTRLSVEYITSDEYAERTGNTEHARVRLWRDELSCRNGTAEFAVTRTGTKSKGAKMNKYTIGATEWQAETPLAAAQAFVHELRDAMTNEPVAVKFIVINEDGSDTKWEGNIEGDAVDVKEVPAAKMDAKDYDLTDVKPEVVERAKKNGIVWSCLERDDPEVYALLGAIKNQQGCASLMAWSKIVRDPYSWRLAADWEPPKPVEKYIYAECKLIHGCCWRFFLPWRATMSASIIEVPCTPGWAGVTDEAGDDWERDPVLFLVQENRIPHRVRFDRQKLIDAGVIDKDWRQQ